MDRHISDQAATLRATHGFKLPDALHVATGIEAGCTVYLTGDAKWARTGLNVIEAANLQLKEEAVRWTVECGKVSTSNLQRKFAIGFQRASRILDTMEEQGVVGSRPREVLISPLDGDGMFGTAPKYDVGGTISEEDLLAD